MPLINVRTTICASPARPSSPLRRLHFLRRTRQTALKTRPALVRPILAAALLLCVLSGTLPAEAALNPDGLKPCCRGTKGTAGECHGNSCPMHRGARKKPARRVEHDPVCGAGRALQAIARTPLPAPRARSEQADSHAHTQAEVEHKHGGSVSPRNTPQAPQPPPSAGAASLGKPCPSDCCGAATASFTGLRRPRQVSALTDYLRARPPAVEPHSHAPSGQIKAASALRRSRPPRAPPAGLHSRTA